MNQTLTETLSDLGAEDALIMDGFDDCILGILERFGIDHPIVVYDREKVIAKTPAFLIKMSEAE